MPAWWDVTWATWALVVVGLATAGVAIFTLITIKRQTEIAGDSAQAAKDSAAAALLQAQAVIKSERPWLVVSHRNPREDYFVFDIKNVGRTPAEIISVRPQFTVQPTVDSLPTGALHDVTLYHRQLLPPGQSWEVFWDFDVRSVIGQDDNLWTLINRNSQRIIFYGTIQYLTPLEDAVTHETSYCFWFNPTIRGLTVGGPEGANKHT